MKIIETIFCIYLYAVIMTWAVYCSYLGRISFYKILIIGLIWPFIFNVRIEYWFMKETFTNTSYEDFRAFVKGYNK